MNMMVNLFGTHQSTQSVPWAATDSVVVVEVLLLLLLLLLLLTQLIVTFCPDLLMHLSLDLVNVSFYNIQMIDFWSFSCYLIILFK